SGRCRRDTSGIPCRERTCPRDSELRRPRERQARPLACARALATRSPAMDLRTAGSRPHDRDIVYKPSHRLGAWRAAEFDPPCPSHDVIADAERTQGATDRQIELTELSLRSVCLRS